MATTGRLQTDSQNKSFMGPFDTASGSGKAPRGYNVSDEYADFGVVLVDAAGNPLFYEVVGADGVTNTSTRVPTDARLHGYNGATWDRLRVDASKNLKTALYSGAGNPISVMDGTTDGRGGAVDGLIVQGYEYVFNGATWDRKRSKGTGWQGVVLVDSNGDALIGAPTTVTDNMAAPGAVGRIGTHPLMLNAAGTYNPLRSVGVGADPGNVPILAVHSVVTDGTAFRRSLSASAAHGTSGTAIPSSGGLVSNGTTMELEQGNTQGQLLASGARGTAQTVAGPTNVSARGVMVVLRVTAASGTGGLSVRINAIDPVSGSSLSLNPAPTPVTATGNFVYALYPGIEGAAITPHVTQRTSMPLPRSWEVVVGVGDASAYTYSLAYFLVR